MKNLKTYIGALLLLGGAFTACQDDVDKPRMEIPEATLVPNTTIAAVKEAYWDDATNYIDTIRCIDAEGNLLMPDGKPVREGNHVVIAGRVVSSDREGNVYKNLVIQDATAAITLSINRNGLYNDYRIGQEIVLDLTDMYIGKYNGLQQLGFPEWYAAGNAWEATFMSYEFFLEHSQLNGLPEPSKVDTLTVSDFATLSTNPEGLRKWQSQLVKFTNVHFDDGGKLAWTDGYKVNTNRTLKDAFGNSLTVRTSGYANFRDAMLPEGEGDLVAILGFYGTSGWQLTVNGPHGWLKPKGTADNPYTIDEAIETEKGLAPGAAGPVAWTEGYIVGTVKPERTTVSSSDDIDWNAEDILGLTLVLGPTAETTDINQCLVLELPQGTPLWEYGNITDNPGNYKRHMKVRGELASYMGTYGMINLPGTAGSFEIEGVDVPGGDTPVTPPAGSGDGSEANPFTVAQIIAVNPQDKENAPDGYSDIWMTGYIVGYYANFTAVFSAGGAVNNNILVADSPTAAAQGQCVDVQLPYGDIRTALNLMDKPGNLGKKVTLFGSVMKYNSMPGLKNTSKYKLEGSENPDTPDTPVTPPAGSGDGTEAKPYSPEQIIAVNPQDKEKAPEGYSDIWVEGYIVGYYANFAAVFSADGAVNANMLLASSASETSQAKCIDVQLPYGDVRTALNLMDNPANLGKKVALFGSAMKYNSMPGIKNTSKYKFL